MNEYIPLTWDGASRILGAPADAMSTYAIIETGGKQYRVAEGDVLDVERLKDVEPGDVISLDRVVLLHREGQVAVGAPYVEGARVRARVLDEHKDKKVIVFKYKPKVRYRRKVGHRQILSRIQIDGIE